MKIFLLSDDAVRVEAAGGQMTVESDTADRQFSPFHMLAAGLGYCTWSVLYSWAEHAKLDAARLAVEVRWTFAEDPHRVGTMTMKIDWPGLPEGRRTAAQRAAGLCAVHATLHQPPTVSVEVAA